MIMTIILTIIFFTIIVYLLNDEDFSLGIRSYIIAFLVSLFFAWGCDSESNDPDSRFNLKRQYMIAKTQYYKTHKNA